ncbi:Conserved_hypothetical protein [Hexamita inflata]|uniref:Uncharacterized protein n=1 Tax=Hexamita inflata TaxID=28002 RepID=A0AA86PIQ5_9EUKA|nr:Conserved hypothetical protein [Hexamita inflata]
MLEEQQIVNIIQSLLQNEIPDIQELISQLYSKDSSTIHTIVLALTNLRQLSDKPLSDAAFKQFIMISETIFDVYADFCSRLLKEKQYLDQIEAKQYQPEIHSPEPSNVSNSSGIEDPSFADMNILLNSLLTYFTVQDKEKLHASVVFRGHKLFTSHLLWRGLFNAALDDQNLHEIEDIMVFLQIQSQISIYVHLMRTFGIVEEDVRLWVQYFINSSSKKYNLNTLQISMYNEQLENILSGDDAEESVIPFIYRNKIIRVTPNYTGYRSQYVDPDRFKKIQFQDEPLFNSEQEQLIKELTTMLSEPVEMQTQLQNEETIHALSREELIDKIWAENTNLISYDKMVPNGQADNLNSMIDQYLKAMDGPEDEKEDSEWDDERQLEYIQNEFGVE